MTGTQTSVETAPAASSHSRKLVYTAYEGNSWQATFEQAGELPADTWNSVLGTFELICNCAFSFSGVTVLVDPWLEGDLVFAKQTWLYRGQKGALKDIQLDIDAIGTKADVILLSQVTFGSVKSHFRLSVA